MHCRRSCLATVVLLSFLLLGCGGGGGESSGSESYRVSGRVITAGGWGLANVEIRYSATDFVLTDKDGFWSVPALSGEVRLTPVWRGYEFRPAEIGVGAFADDIEFEAVWLDGDRSVERVSNWFRQQQRDNGLLESAEGNDFVSLYDNALAAMVFLSRGDTANTEKIFNFFDARIDAELLVGNGGFSQFRSGDGVPRDDRRWMGDNAWLLIALNNYESLTGSNAYERLALEIESWLRSLQDSDGGLFGGYDANGVLIPKITEGMIDAYNAVPGYDGFHADLLQFLEEERWDAADRNLVAWPGNAQYLYALDLHSWSYILFEDYPVSALTSADRFLTTQVASATGAEVRGYSFDEDRDTVWLEGTGQMAAAFQVAGMREVADFYLSELEKVLLSSGVHADSAGIPYASNPGTTYGSGLLWERADLDIVVSSSAWYLFARIGFHPFAAGRKGDASVADRFWGETW